MASPSCTVYENTLGGTRPRRHIAPQIRTAGHVGKRDFGTVGELTSNYYSSGRVTPDLVRAYRRGGEVGRTHRYYGFAKDPPLDEDVRHGVRGPPGEGVRGCLQPGLTADRMTALVEEQLEQFYASHQRNPLGRCPDPRYQVPVPRGGFGMKTDRSESLKRVVFCGREVDVLHPAGEQKNRGYDWESTGIDPTQHRFGKPLTSGVHSEDVIKENKPITTMLPKLMEDFNTTAYGELGKSRPYGFDNSVFDKTFEKNFVRRTRKGDGDAAREVLSAWASHPAVLQAEEVARTKALDASADATCATDGFEDGSGLNSTKGRSRVMCKYDGKHRGSRSVTDLDDDVRVPHVLYPCHYVQMGVQSKYFAGGRNLENIRELSKKVGFNLSDNQIDEVFHSISHDGTCGIEQFKNKAVEMGYM